jgi:hypothetical protein
MYRFVALLLLTAVAFPAAAEVSDKIPSHAALWGVCSVVGVLSLAAGAFRPWLGIFGIAYALLVLMVSHADLTDPYVGPAILVEQGQSYALSAYGSPALTFVLSAIGIMVGLRRRRVRKASAG